jgi:hypothetical protein
MDFGNYLSRIAEEFGFDENERDVKLGGLIALGFFFVGAPASYVIGWLADSVNRTPLFAATVFIGEAGCLMVYFVQTYQQLYACRVLTGISIGGAIPIVYSVLGDLYPANQRSVVAAVVTTGSGLGMGIGQIIAGVVSDWRRPFLYVSIPGLICSIAVLFLKDPPRGSQEAAVLETLERRNNNVIEQESALSQSDVLLVSVARGEHIQSLQNCGADCEANVRASDLTTKATNVLNPEIHVHSSTLSEVATSHEHSASNENNRRCISCTSTLELIKTPSVLLIILQAAPGSRKFERYKLSHVSNFTSRALNSWFIHCVATSSTVWVLCDFFK